MRQRLLRVIGCGALLCAALRGNGASAQTGSGEGITAIRAAILPPCAAKAIRLPAVVAAACSHTGNPAVA